MDDAAAGRHPLDAARHQLAAVAAVVLVPHHAGEHVGHRLEAAVRVIGKAGRVVVAALGTELVEEQERIGRIQLGPAEAAPKLDAGAVGSVASAHHARHGA